MWKNNSIFSNVYKSVAFKRQIVINSNTNVFAISSTFKVSQFCDYMFFLKMEFKLP